jgi:hypothetical protein
MELNGFEINRKTEIGMHKISEVFSGLENLEVLEKLFGGQGKLKNILENLSIRITKQSTYMWVDEENGIICIGSDYFSTGNKKYIYLDIVHELVHIKQMMEGRKLFDRNYKYVDRQTEIEAYKITVEEAKRIGMNENEIRYYLNVEWINNEDRLRLLKEMGMI